MAERIQRRRVRGWHATWPREGEVWRNAAGAVREVRSVDEDGYSVTYSRPTPAPFDWTAVPMAQWESWASDAVCIRKAGAPLDKDWGYATDVR